MNKNEAAIVVACEAITPSLLAELAPLYINEPYKAAIWSWQFRSRFGRECLAIVARQENRLIGFNATMPVRIQTGEKQQDAIWSCDFIVAEGFRGKGVGNAIKSRMLETFTVPIMSMGISDDALPILVKKGWTQGPIVPVLKKICRPQNIRDYLLYLSSILSGLPRLFIQKKFTFFKSNTEKFVSKFYDSGSLPEAALINEILCSQRTNRNVSVVKDHTYLSWRYQQYPWNEYTALFVSTQDGRPCGLLIYRSLASTDLEVVDYIGDESDIDLITFALQKIIYRHATTSSVTWSCSSESLHQNLHKCGFLKKSYGSRFVCFDPGNEINNRSWLLAAGDSDGDFLKAAKKNALFMESPLKEPATHNDFSIIRIDEQKFLACEEEWNSLVTASKSDGLFMSWAWQSAWWLTWKEKLQLELFVHFIFYNNELVGILPLYRRPNSKAGKTELQFIGNAWRVAPSVRSEYIAPLLKLEHQQSLTHCINEWLAKSGRFGHIILPDHVIRNEVMFRNSVVRQCDTGYVVNTTGDIHSYLMSLGAQTRLKAFNRLQYLEQQYPNANWEFVQIANAELTSFFGTLNDLHILRWGKPCFDDYALDFHRRIITGENGIEPFLHRLCIDGQTVSVSYNLACMGKMYNIQSGYLQNFDKKLSLGTLHFGKVLTICFESSGIHSLDFLAGSGKNTDYKNHFNGAHIDFVTLQIFSSSVSQRIFSLKKSLKAKLS